MPACSYGCSLPDKGALSLGKAVRTAGAIAGGRLYVGPAKVALIPSTVLTEFGRREFALPAPLRTTANVVQPTSSHTIGFAHVQPHTVGGDWTTAPIPSASFVPRIESKYCTVHAAPIRPEALSGRVVPNQRSAWDASTGYQPDTMSARGGRIWASS